MSWIDELHNSLTTSEEINTFFDFNFPKTEYPIRIPRNFAKTIKDLGPQSPLWKQFLPTHSENADEGLEDPIGDQACSKTPGLIHRYANRVLLTPTKACPIICRYCFRKNELYSEDVTLSLKLNESLAYLREHPEVNEVILTGGDPLMLNDEKLLKLAYGLKEIKTIKYLRIHTRFPIVIPSRLDDHFFSTCQKLKSIFNRFHLVIHCNHSEEISIDLESRLREFSAAGIEILSQTVLLNGINADSEVLINIFEKLIDCGVSPYYLHHPDQVKGGMHFMLSLQHGRRIYSKLRNRLPGWALPEYVIDIPGGYGKSEAYNPEEIKFSGRLLDKNGQLRNVIEPKI